MVLEPATIEARVDAGDEVGSADGTADGRAGFALHAAIVAERFAAEETTFVKEWGTEKLSEARRVHREPPASMPCKRVAKFRSATERCSATVHTQHNREGSCVDP